MEGAVHTDLDGLAFNLLLRLLFGLLLRRPLLGDLLPGFLLGLLFRGLLPGGFPLGCLLLGRLFLRSDLAFLCRSFLGYALFSRLFPGRRLLRFLAEVLREDFFFARAFDFLRAALAKVHLLKVLPWCVTNESMSHYCEPTD